MPARLEENMSIEAYHSMAKHEIINGAVKPGVVSKSMLGVMADCPARFKYMYLDGGEYKDTKSLRLGQAVHTLALEPEKFHSTHYVLPEGLRRDKRTSAYQEQLAFANGRSCLSVNEYGQIKGMAQSLSEHKKAMILLQQKGKVESSIFWKDEETGIDCRCRPDFMRDDGIIVDLKTTNNADPEVFMKNAWNFHYDLSVAMTSEGYKALTGKMPSEYIFLSIETEPPYIVEAYHSYGLSSYYEAGMKRWRPLMARYVDCVKNNTWPSYSTSIDPMVIPYWAKKQLLGEAHE